MSLMLSIFDQNFSKVHYQLERDKLYMLTKREKMNDCLEAPKNQPAYAVTTADVQ